MNKLVLNIERVGRQSTSWQGVHDQRKGGNLDHINHKRTKTNRILVGSGDPLADCEALIKAKGATVPKNNEKPITRFVLSASPEFFKDENGTVQSKPTAEFTKKAMDFLKEEFGDSLAYAVLHMDEATPHIHAAVVPLVEKKTKRRTRWTVSHHQHPAFKGLNSFERLRRKCADSLGLDYGEPGNKPRTLKQRQAEEEAQAKAAEAGRQSREAKGMLMKAKDTWEKVQQVAGTVARDAKRLGVVVESEAYAQDPDSPEARGAVRKTLVKGAAGRTIEAQEVGRQSQAPDPAQQPKAKPKRKKTRAFWQRGDSH